MMIEPLQDGASRDPVAAESSFERALSLRRQGEARRADALCIDLLQADPRHFNAFANHPEQLRALRSRLALQGRRSPLFDTARYTGHLETAFRRMLEQPAK